MAVEIPKQYKGVVYDEPGKISTKIETLDMPYVDFPISLSLYGRSCLIWNARKRDGGFNLLTVGMTVNFTLTFSSSEPGPGEGTEAISCRY